MGHVQKAAAQSTGGVGLFHLHCRPGQLLLSDWVCDEYEQPCHRPHLLEGQEAGHGNPKLLSEARFVNALQRGIEFIYLLALLKDLRRARRECGHHKLHHDV